MKGGRGEAVGSGNGDSSFVVLVVVLARLRLGVDGMANPSLSIVAEAFLFLFAVGWGISSVSVLPFFLVDLDIAGARGEVSGMNELLRRKERRVAMVKDGVILLRHSREPR